MRAVVERAAGADISVSTPEAKLGWLAL